MLSSFHVSKKLKLKFSKINNFHLVNAYARDLNAPDQSGDYTVLLETKLRIQETVREWIRYARYGDGATPY